MAETTYFDSTGIVPAACTHGLKDHPNDRVGSQHALNRFVRKDDDGNLVRGSWIRSKYLDERGYCPVCRGEPRPDDMTEARDGS